MKQLSGKNCLITGAASGIGRSLAMGLAKEGMNLFLSDIDKTNLEETRRLIEREGIRVVTGQCDVSKLEDLKKLDSEMSSQLGPVDLLINNAGIAAGGFVESIDPGEWEHVLAVNTWSVIYAVSVFLPGMIQRKSGHIVNVGSGAGIVGIPYHIQYVVSKFAVVGITEALYSEINHVHKGIHFSVICPTYLKTNIIQRTPIRIPPKLVKDGTRDDLEKRIEEFKDIFWEKYTEGAPSVDKVVAKYIQGIKKNRLYIFDMPQLRIASVLKGLSDRLYRNVLRSEGHRYLNMIKETLEEMGIRTKDP